MEVCWKYVEVKKNTAIDMAIDALLEQRRRMKPQASAAQYGFDPAAYAAGLRWGAKAQERIDKLDLAISTLRAIPRLRTAGITKDERTQRSRQEDPA